MPATDLPNLNSVLDLPVSISAHFASTTRSLKEILDLKVGTVLLLEAQPADTVSLYANTIPFARGDIVTVDQTLAIQLNAILPGLACS